MQLRTLLGIKDALVAEWRLIPKKRLQTLIRSMRMKCRVVIDARGRHSHY